MKIDINIKNTKDIINEHGLGENGRVQKRIDSDVIKKMEKYEPALNNELRDSLILGTIVGSGKLVYQTAKGRFLYYGKLMVSSVTGSAYASKGESKVVTDKDLEYNKSVHPLAGAYWFERMKANDKDEILNNAQTEANKKQ